MPRFLADVLTWPGNRFYITAIKAARDFSVPPTVLILKDRQPGEWLPVDKKLAIALQILEDETCPDCGTPIWLGHSEDSSVVFDVKSRTCYSCAEIETQRERDEKRNKKHVKGQKKFVVMAASEKAPPSRGSFLKEQAGIIEGGNAVEFD